MYTIRFIGPEMVEFPTTYTGYSTKEAAIKAAKLILSNALSIHMIGEETENEIRYELDYDTPYMYVVITKD